MVNFKDKKISTLIQKLVDLKTAKKRFQAKSLRLPFYQTEREDALWSRDVQPIIDEIEIDLVELWDCILKNTEWKKVGIETAIRSREPDEIYRIERLIHELRLIQRRLEIKPQQPETEQPAETGRNTSPAKMKYDVFICHASEDKKDFVKPLADALIKEKMRVWYVEFELTLGDSFREKIDYGLANSEYGVVVLSEAFFRKKWPQDELDGLVTRQNSEGKKVILPIWHKVSYDEVKRFSPTLAGKVAAKSEKGIKQVVDDILKVINYSGREN